MRKIITFKIILCFFGGCASDKETADSFVNCLSHLEQKSYANLVSLCDKFVLSNYPDDQLDDGYQKFLDGLLEADPKTWKIDTSMVYEMNFELAKVFGDTYDQGRANFLIGSPLTKCLQESNRTRLSLKRIGLENLLEDKKKSGQLSPNLIAGAMQANRISPTKGIGKTIFVTEVLWRLLYLNSVKE
jgi:hypothetical protein